MATIETKDLTEDPNADASDAAPSSTEETTFAPAANAGGGESPSEESSPAEPKSFEQRVEERFLALEHALMNLPHAIATANGHPEPESWRQRVLSFLFGKHEEPSA